MSASTGVPTYTSAPLNSNTKKKEQENTYASTSQPEPATTIESSIATSSLQPANTSATATAPSYSPIYTTAQPSEPAAPKPGAAPSLPTPTATTAIPHQQGNLAAPTSTTSQSTTASSQSPPAPQPGARPYPASTAPATTQQSSAGVPPPPKAGEAILPSLSASAPAPAATTPTQPPFSHSYAYQPPSQAQSTIPPNSTSAPYASVYHSPSPGTAAAGSARLPLHHNNASGGGASSIFPDEEPSFLTTAKSWMQSAGTKLAEVEAEVWKKINDVHDEK